MEALPEEKSLGGSKRGKSPGPAFSGKRGGPSPAWGITAARRLRIFFSSPFRYLDKEGVS
jgi:hypothetical protein